MKEIKELIKHVDHSEPMAEVHGMLKKVNCCIVIGEHGYYLYPSGTVSSTHKAIMEHGSYENLVEKLRAEIIKLTPDTEKFKFGDKVIFDREEFVYHQHIFPYRGWHSIFNKDRQLVVPGWEIT